MKNIFAIFALISTVSCIPLDEKEGQLSLNFEEKSLTLKELQAKGISGEVVVVQGDYLNQNQFSEDIYLQDFQTDELIKLNLNENEKQLLPVGSHFGATEFPISRPKSAIVPTRSSLGLFSWDKRKKSHTRGIKKVLVINAKYSNLPESDCKIQDQREIWVGGSDFSVSKFIELNSKGRMSLDVEFVQDVVDVGSSRGVCSYKSFDKKFKILKKKMKNYNLDNYHFISVNFPLKRNCFVLGWANIGGRKSFLNGMGCNAKTVTHELGHSLGLKHAGTKTNPYGDLSDIMGGGLNNINNFNPNHLSHIFWLHDKKDFITVKKDGEYLISPLHPVEKNTLPKSLKVKHKGKVYNVSYRRDASSNYHLSLHAQRTYDKNTILIKSDVKTLSYKGLTYTLLRKRASSVTIKVEGF